ncbi:MAG TPA: efflux transporter outer membrane subunit [Candidatus Acidoferrales bacterium]|jgi:NodT family efflux transporter outer membrane factor (OMF) lipoprotein|nr:efflux transporter outer membrane subunit [Candidatus Acidoferrales bacterium]
MAPSPRSVCSPLVLRFARLPIVSLGLLLGILLAAGCSVGPKYVKPTTQIPPSYKENADWKPAQPSDTAQKGNWWEIFQDPQLNALEDKIAVSNQSLRAAVDRFQEARDVFRQTRSALYPFVSAGLSPSQNRQSTNKALRGATSPANYSDLLLQGQISYEVDAWGSVRHSVQQSRNLAQASASDLETIRLSLHAELALDYMTLRGLDAQKQLFDSNVAAFQKAVDLTEERFRGGVASREDVDLADTELEQTRAQDIDITSTRDQFEHAVAVLIGQPASSFRLDPAQLPAIPPVPPPGIPSDLLERRPDISSAERRVAAANEQVGIARAAFFPTITLGLAAGFESGQFPNWLTGPSAVWAIGASAAETVFDAGRRRAVSDQALATYDEMIADYQQTVLTSFQQVEDSLSDLRVLEEEAKTQDAAVAAANRAVEQSTNRYKGGLDTYLTVITAQNAALENQRTAVSLLTRRLTSTVLLVKALGGGWDVSKLPSVDAQASAVPAR